MNNEIISSMNNGEFSGNKNPNKVNPVDFYQPGEVDFRPYLRAGVRPPLERNQLKCLLTNDDNRGLWGIHVGGDASLFIHYKGKAAFAMSYKMDGPNLQIVQMQGGGDKGYRVNTGMNVPGFFADQTRALLLCPENVFFDRIVLPQTIKGIDEDQTLVDARKEGIPGKYAELRQLLCMEFNPDMNAFVLEKSNAT